MIALHWLLLLVIGWSVLVVCKPEVHWHLQSWQYRDPEANYPSDTWFFLHRLGAVVTIIVALVLWGAMWESAPAETSITRPDASEESSSSPQPRPESKRHTLTATQGEAGRISGYTVDAEDELTVYVSLGPCTFPHLHVLAREDEDTITLTSSAYTNESSCKEGSDRSLRKAVTLNEPVGDREVVDIDGTAVRLCEERC